jgi:hypothetical protein
MLPRAVLLLLAPSLLLATALAQVQRFDYSFSTSMMRPSSSAQE